MIRSRLQGTQRTGGDRPRQTWQKMVNEEVWGINPNLYRDSEAEEYSVKPLLGFAHCLDRFNWKAVEGKNGVKRKAMRSARVPANLPAAAPAPQ